MRDSLRRLLMRHSVEHRDPATDKPFRLASGGESWTYLDVRRTTLLPHGLYATGMVLLNAFLTDEAPEETHISAIAGPAIGAIPLAASLTLTAYANDQESAPTMLIVRKEAKDHGTGKVIEGADLLPEGSGVLVVEDVVTRGNSTIQTINTLKSGGFAPLLVITLVDRGVGGLEAITKETGVRAIAVYQMADLLTPSVDDHVLFLPAQGDAPDGMYLMHVGGGEWRQCSTEQNTYLHANKAQHVPHKPTDERLGGAEQFGEIFYVDGVLRP